MCSLLSVCLILSLGLSDPIQEQIGKKRKLFDDRNASLERAAVSLQAPDLSPAEREILLTQRTALAHDMQRIDEELSDLSAQQSKRPRSSFTVTVPGEEVGEAVLWKAEVVDKQVSRPRVGIAAANGCMLCCVPRAHALSPAVLCAFRW